MPPPWRRAEIVPCFDIGARRSSHHAGTVQHAPDRDPRTRIHRPRVAPADAAPARKNADRGSPEAAGDSWCSGYTSDGAPQGLFADEIRHDDHGEPRACACIRPQGGCVTIQSAETTRSTILRAALAVMVFGLFQHGVRRPRDGDRCVSQRSRIPARPEFVGCRLPRQPTGGSPRCRRMPNRAGWCAWHRRCLLPRTAGCVPVL
jgi:hypothetical protein